MKAVINNRYGSPDVLRFMEVEKPEILDDEVLINIRAVSLNAYDWHLLRADPFFVRMMGSGFFAPNKKIPGADISGIIDQVGSKVSSYKIGDEVFGCLSSCRNGGLAEFASATPNVLTLKPEGISFEDAACVPMAAITALQALRDYGKILAGQKVLINGASGGVGTFAIQIAKVYGAEVTGVCGTRNLNLIQSIGADFVIDYSKEDFTKNTKQYDLILDIAANHMVSEYVNILSSNGKCIMVGFSTIGRMLINGMIESRAFKKDNKHFSSMTASIQKEDLDLLANLLATGKLVPVIDRKYMFEDVVEAFHYLETKHANGKIVISIPAS